MDTSTYSAEWILAIPLDQPERLYSPDFGKMREERQSLLKMWYPDFCSHPKATDVAAHINALYDRAQQKLAYATWETPDGDKEWVGRDKKIRRMKVHAKFKFELGKVYLSRKHVAFEIPESNLSLLQEGLKRLSGLRYANEDMKKMMSPNFPIPRSFFYVKNGAVAVMERPPESIRLQDFLDHHKGSVNPKHVAWIISRLLNTVCYFQWAGFSHNALNLDTVYVVPETHQVLVLGGWWYAQRLGVKMDVLPKTTADNIPSAVLRAKKGDIRTDLAMVRWIARELVKKNFAAVPKPMADWINSPTEAKAHADYSQWSKALDKAFGPRVFVPCNVTFKEVYG